MVTKKTRVKVLTGKKGLVFTSQQIGNLVCIGVTGEISCSISAEDLD